MPYEAKRDVLKKKDYSPIRNAAEQYRMISEGGWRRTYIGKSPEKILDPKTKRQIR